MGAQGLCGPQATIAAGPRLRVASLITALVLAGVLLALMIVDVPLAGLARQSLNSSGGSAPVWFSAAFGAVGFVVAWRKPRNPLGWLLLGGAVFLTLSQDASFYMVADYRLRHGGLPLGWVAVLAQPGWALGIVLAGLAILLFPDGRLALPPLAVGPVGLPCRGHAVPGRCRGGHGGRHQRSPHSRGFQREPRHAFPPHWFCGLVGCGRSRVPPGARSLLAGFAGSPGGQLSALVRRAPAAQVAAERIGHCRIGIPLTTWLSGMHGILGVAGSIAGAATLLALPVCMGVAILKYRLFDIDRIVSRTLAYTIVTGLLVGLYAGLVLLATRVLSVSSPVAVAAATLAAAALFNPLRHRVQRDVDRRFNRARYDTDQMVTAFAARLQGAVNLGTVRDDLTGIVHTALEPSHVSVWIRQP